MGLLVAVADTAAVALIPMHLVEEPIYICMTLISCLGLLIKGVIGKQMVTLFKFKYCIVSASKCIPIFCFLSTLLQFRWDATFVKESIIHLLVREALQIIH